MVRFQCKSSATFISFCQFHLYYLFHHDIKGSFCFHSYRQIFVVGWGAPYICQWIAPVTHPHILLSRPSCDIQCCHNASRETKGLCVFLFVLIVEYLSYLAQSMHFEDTYLVYFCFFFLWKNDAWQIYTFMVNKLCL